MVTVSFRSEHPGVHRQRLELATADDLTEEHPRWKIQDRDLDSNLPELLLDDPFGLFPGLVPSSGVDLKLQALPGGVTHHAIRPWGEASLLEEPARSRWIIRVLLDGLGVAGMPGREVRVRDWLPACEQLLGDLDAVDPMRQGAARAHILQQRVVQVEVDMFPDQACRLPDDLYSAFGLAF